MALAASVMEPSHATRAHSRARCMGTAVTGHSSEPLLCPGLKGGTGLFSHLPFSPQHSLQGEATRALINKSLGEASMDL